MIRKFKVLGLALVAALALSAVTASAASAVVEFHSEDAPQSVTAEETGGGHVFTTEAGQVTCPGTKFDGTTSVKTTTTFTLRATYPTPCTAFGISTTHIVAGANCPNGEIGYQFHVTNVKHAGNVYTAQASLECEVRITPTIFGFSACTATVPAQTPTEGEIELTNAGTTTTRDLTATIHMDKIHYSSTGGSCGSAGAHTDGEYDGGATVKGYKDGASHTAANHRGIWVE